VLQIAHFGHLEKQHVMMRDSETVVERAFKLENCMKPLLRNFLNGVRGVPAQNSDMQVAEVDFGELNLLMRQSRSPIGEYGFAVAEETNI
jgi:hypothetical protein